MLRKKFYVSYNWAVLSHITAGDHVGSTCGFLTHSWDISWMILVVINMFIGYAVMLTANWCVGSIWGPNRTRTSPCWSAGGAALWQDDPLLSGTQVSRPNPYHCLRSGLQRPMLVSCVFCVFRALVINEFVRLLLQLCYIATVLYRSTCISQHLQFKNWRTLLEQSFTAQVLIATSAFGLGRRCARVLLNGVTCTVSVPYCYWLQTAGQYRCVYFVKMLPFEQFWLVINAYWSATAIVKRLLVHGQVTIIFVVSVGLFVCLCRVFLSRLWSDFDQTLDVCYMSGSSCAR